jgi:RimJ/RimL family protein N-acetyltransferase
MTLRPYEPGDLDGLHDMYGREDVCRYLPWEPMDVDQARAKLEQRLRQTRIEADGDPLVLAAVDTETGRMIGEFMLRLNNSESRQGEIGWAIHPDAQGRGLATEGAKEMLRLGFDELNLHRIVAGSDPRNIGSTRVMEHLGMRREAQHVESEFRRGEWVDDVICAILESEWRSRSRPVAH